MIFGVPLLLVFLVAVLFGVRSWLDAFLEGAEFRHFLERKTSALLHAQIHIEPLHRDGSEIYSDALDGTGYPGGRWERLSAEQIRSDVDLRALWRGIWRIDSIDLAKVQATVAAESQAPEESSSNPPESESSGPSPATPLARLLPAKVEVGSIHVADFSLFWGGGDHAADGRLQDAELTATQRDDGGGWNVTGRQGRLNHGSLPALILDHFTLKANTHELTITQAQAHAEGGGDVQFSGSQQLDGDRSLAIDCTFDGVPSESFLPTDWRARLHGSATGTVHVTGSPSTPQGLEGRGHVDLRNARLEALPVLDELAVFTATARFRQASLQKASADFDWRGGVLTVSRLELESEGLIRMEGGFTIQDQRIDGRLEVGVARSAGRLLAGIGSRVFNEPEHDGYLWTAVRLSGSADSPHEDLTARLVQATQDEVVDKAKQGTGTVLDTASGLLNLLRPGH